MGEVPNYKERIVFMVSDPGHHFKNKFANSTVLYYNTTALRGLRALVKDTPSYIVSSYPQENDVLLAIYLKIPLFQNYHMSK